MQDLHGNVAFHPRLEPPEHDARRPFADLLHQSIPAEGFAAEVERGILAEDPFMQPREFRRRIDAELVCEDLPRPLERRQRIRLPSFAIQRQHQLSPEARLAEGMTGEERLRLSPPLARSGRSPADLDPFLLGGEPQVIEPRRFGEEG